jgi:hypothetical protein
MRARAASTSGAGWASIGASPRPTSSRNARNPAAPVAGHRQRPAHLGGTHPGGPGHRLGHDPGEGALAQLTGEQAAQEGLLGLGRGGEQVGRQLPAAAGGTRPGLGAEAAEGGVARGL